MRRWLKRRQDGQDRREGPRRNSPAGERGGSAPPVSGGGGCGRRRGDAIQLRRLSRRRGQGNGGAGLGGGDHRILCRAAPLEILNPSCRRALFYRRGNALLTSEACPPSSRSTCVHRSWTRASVRMPWQESSWCSLWASQARCRSRSRTVRPLPSSSGCGTSSALPVRGPGAADPVLRAAGPGGQAAAGEGGAGGGGCDGAAGA
ncbi:uncharacterized protein LOC123776642 [Ursus americanus]|uniref:uncharacterized protein LOC123776642 n=1 Tax=Ursus americanus TaxID=9643 RepID=UPI001E67CAA7|nr:uncharacterized protein LOC123776642 [Ursus americanus]